MGSTEGKSEAGFQPKKWPQLLAAAIATNGAFSLGTVVSWSSPALPELIESQALGPLTSSQASWIASLPVLGAAIAAIPAGYAMEAIGRRKTLLGLSIPLFLGWMVVASAGSVEMLYLGRFVTGLCFGACSLVVPAYLSEISSDKFRGEIGSLFTLQFVLGILFVFILAIIVDLVTLSVICSLPALVLFLGMYFMPESPIYSLGMGREEDAAEALKSLRGANDLEEIEPELKALRNHLKTMQMNGKLHVRDLGERVWHPLGLCAAFMIFQEWSGLLIADAYTAEIFQTAGSGLSPNVSAIIVGVALVVGVVISGLLIDRLGRRILLIGSSLLVVLCWVPLGIAFKLQEENGGVMPEAIQTLPLICLMGFVVFSSLGLAPVIWVLPSELLPADVRGRLGAVVISLNWLAAFTLVRVYDDLAGMLGVYSCFWIFAGVSLACAIFTYIFLPETKGKSQEEISAFFQPNPVDYSKFSDSA